MVIISGVPIFRIFTVGAFSGEATLTFIDFCVPSLAVIHSEYTPFGSLFRTAA